MADGATRSRLPRKRSWRRTFAWVCVAGLLLLVGLYFAVTSSGVLRSFLLPQIGKALNAQITVDDITVHPFSGVTLFNLKVQTTGTEPVLAAQEIRARYSLLAILMGKIQVSEVALVSPTIVVVEQPDGSKNIDAFLGASKAETPAKPAPAAKSSKPPQVDIGKITLSNVTFRNVKNYADGKSDVAEVSNFNLEISNVKNGEKGKLSLNAEMRVDNNPPSPGVSGLLQARLTGNFNFAFLTNLNLATIDGGLRFEVAQATGNLANFSGFAVNLDAEITPIDIRQIALRFERSKAILGELRVSGPFDMRTSDGRLTVEVRSVDRQLLNLAAANTGMDFGSTTISSKSQIDLSKTGTFITATGRVDVAKFQVTRTNAATPAVDVRVQYDVTIDSAARNVRLALFNLTGTQNGNPLLRSALTRPFEITWSGTAQKTNDSALTLAITNLNLADWKPFLGETVPSGTVNAGIKLAAQEGGRLLAYELNSRIENLSVVNGSNLVSQIGIDLQSGGQVRDLKEFTLANLRLQVARQKQPMVDFSVSGTADTDGNADLQLLTQLMLVDLLATAPNPEVALLSGLVNLQAHVTQKQTAQAITASLSITNVTGRIVESQLNAFGFTTDVGLVRNNQQLKINKLAGALTADGRPGGSFAVSGTCDLADKSADLKAMLVNFNQDSLRPFIEPLIAPQKMSSVAIEADFSLQSASASDLSLKGELQVTNLVVTDALHHVLPSLDTKIQIDASLHKQVAKLGRLRILLSPTARAKNELLLAGQVDLSHTNALTGSLKLTAESLDFTPYYDIYAAIPKYNDAPPPLDPSASANGNEEPAAMELPVRDFTFEVEIGQLCLREVEVKQFKTTAKLDGAHVVVNPFQLTLNDAPVSAKVDADLGVPGYKYDVGLNAMKIPLAPFVNSFQPERAGKLGGTLTIATVLSGAGTTGVNLKKNLTGNFDIVTTNLDLSIADVKDPRVFAVVNVIVGLPDLLGGTWGGKQGWADDFTSKPIDMVTIRGVAGEGVINLQEATVQGVNFQAEAPGKIEIADVLTNSTLNIPIAVSLGYHSAEEIGLVPNGTPTNVAYVKLPEFLTIIGTIGAPVPEIKKGQLLLLAAKTGAGLGKNIGKAVGKSGNSVGTTVGQGATSIFKSIKSKLTSKTNAPATNNPSESP